MPRFDFTRWCAAAAVAAAAVPSLLAAQITPGEYAARRAALLAQIDSGAVIAFGEVEPVTHWPPFAQLPSFEYLTGFEEPDAALLLVKRGGGTATRLFLQPRDLRMERFVGARTGPAEAQARTGIPGRPLAGLRAAVDSLAAAGLPLYVVSDVHTTDFARQDSLTRGSRFVELLRRDHPALRVQPLDSVVLRMRARKSPAEIALLRRAAEISGEAHRQAMRTMAPGCSEGEIQGVMENTFRALGGERPGYGSIVGSGPNALALHYQRNERVMRPGEVVVIDAATALRHYSADVTRTLPVTGRFTPDQRAIYQVVLDAQAAYVRQVRPGANRLVAADSGRAVMAAGLVRLGLIESADSLFDSDVPCPSDGCRQVRLFAWHGYGGHGIGLEVHDPAQYYYAPGTFEPGDVFTVEPGIYVRPEMLDQLPGTPRNRALSARLRAAVQRFAGIGVRIEDDYLVTDRGVEWLSRGVPRTIAEVEAAMGATPRTRCGGSSGR